MERISRSPELAITSPISRGFGPPSMRPEATGDAPADDLFRLRLEQMVDPRHEPVPRVELSGWSRFDAESVDLFRPSRGAPAVPTRMIAWLHYLEHAFALSGEDVVRCRVENTCRQCFCGESDFRHEPPNHQTTMTRRRKRIGEKGCERLPIESIEAARRAGALADGDRTRVNVGTTVQEKDIARPTDGKLIDDARRQPVRPVAEHGLPLRKDCNRVAKAMWRKIAGNGCTKQYRRMRPRTAATVHLEGHARRRDERDRGRRGTRSEKAARLAAGAAFSCLDP